MKRVYVCIPSNVITGGCESLYQLVDCINNLGGTASVVWNGTVTEKHSVPLKYQKYNLKFDITEFCETDIIVYPEIWTDKIHTYKNIKKAIWWLSVDNNRSTFKDWDNTNILHLCQSYYSLDFIIKNNGVNYLYLNDYISDFYTKQIPTQTQKENIVIYNPAKGYDITKKIIDSLPDFTFIPIQNLDENETINLLQKAKIYIDFGHHPGKDRIPREAASQGCIVITNTEGSSFFYRDVPIPLKYKTNCIDTAGELIKNCLLYYKENYQKQEFYRLEILKQKQQLFNICKKIFL